MNNLVICIAQTPNHANRIVKQLLDDGFSRTKISVLMSNVDAAVRFPLGRNLAGATAARSADESERQLDSALDRLVDVCRFNMPGLGPSLGAGPLLAALSALAPAGACSEFKAQLLSIGIGDFEARRTVAKLKGGNLLIAVHSDLVEEQERAAIVCYAAYAVDVYTTGATVVSHAAARLCSPTGRDQELMLRDQP